MTRRQVMLRQGIKVLFIVIFLSGLSGGCASPVKESKKRITGDVLTFRDLQEIDLDKDGQKEIIALYSTGVNSSGVKVIKVSKKGREDIIFERVFDTPHTRFEMRKGIPTLIVQETVQVPKCGKTRLKSIYSWDGKAFVKEPK